MKTLKELSNTYVGKGYTLAGITTDLWAGVFYRIWKERLSANEETAKLSFIAYAIKFRTFKKAALNFVELVSKDVPQSKPPSNYLIVLKEEVLEPLAWALINNKISIPTFVDKLVTVLSDREVKYQLVIMGASYASLEALIEVLKLLPEQLALAAVFMDEESLERSWALALEYKTRVIALEKKDALTSVRKVFNNLLSDLCRAII